VTADRRGGLQVAGAALLWSLGGIGIKAVAEPPLKIAAYRSVAAAVALFLLFRPGLAERGRGFLAVSACYAACLTTFVVATKWTTAANAIFLQYSGVIWVMLLSPIVVKEPLRIRDGIAIAIAFAGMALFFVGKLRAGGAGDLVALSSGIFWAGLVLSLRRERNGGAEAVVTYGNILTAAALLPFLAGDLSLSPRSAVLLLFLGVVQLAAAYVLFVRGLKTVTATQASLIGMAEPVLNPVWVFFVLGEKPSGYALLGGAIVLGAIAWRTLSSPSIAPVPPPD